MKSICITIYCLSVFLRHGAVSQIVFTDSEIHNILETDKKQSPDMVVQSEDQDTTKYSNNEKLKNEDRKNIWSTLIDVNNKEVTNHSAETQETDTLGIIIIVVVSIAIFTILIVIWLCCLYRFDCRKCFLERRSKQRHSDLAWIVNNQNQENI